MDLPDPERFHEAAIAFGIAAVALFPINPSVTVELGGIATIFELVASRLDRIASRRPAHAQPRTVWLTANVGGVGTLAASVTRGSATLGPPGHTGIGATGSGASGRLG